MHPTAVYLVLRGCRLLVVPNTKPLMFRVVLEWKTAASALLVEFNMTEGWWSMNGCIGIQQYYREADWQEVPAEAWDRVLPSHIATLLGE